ncbi:MAG: hypothetical protein OEY11_00995 [Gammaproteobacteria bacterium]|nr:hypothetical protein [Gammaproteobacteria bacterium]
MLAVFLKRIILLAIFLISACQSEFPGNSSAAPLKVITASSGSAVLEGVFKSPCLTLDVNSDGVDDAVMHFFSVSGRVITNYTQYYYSSSNCDGTAVVINRCQLNIASTTDAMLTTWVDKTGRPAAPPATAADENVLLPQRPAYTSITAEVMQSEFKAQIGLAVPYGFVVDNSRSDGLKIYMTTYNFVEGQAGIEAFHTSY